jgi:hypothetical protein
LIKTTFKKSWAKQFDTSSVKKFGPTFLKGSSVKKFGPTFLKGSSVKKFGPTFLKGSSVKKFCHTFSKSIWPYLSQKYLKGSSANT